MSVDQTEAGAEDICCASCGIAELDDIKLKKCDDCDLVRYCSDDCKEHQSQHQAMCKKRAAELRDEILFRQPEGSHMGDCPICCLPLPLLDHQKSPSYSCCGKIICMGCDYANQKRELEGKLQPACPFCRQKTPASVEEVNKNKMKRAAANDPVAMSSIAITSYNEGDYDTAFEHWTKAAELGDVEAQYNLSHLYREGDGVEKDENRGLYHLVEAAIAGHPSARYNLALKEGRDGRYDRSAKHLIIAASLGHDGSIKMLKGCYKHGLVSKEDFAAALRGHQAAVDATKSPQREEAAEYIRRRQLE